MATFKNMSSWLHGYLCLRREGGIYNSMVRPHGVVLGVATLVIVQAVMIGFEAEFVEKIVGANSHLTIYKKTLTTDLMRVLILTKYEPSYKT